MMRAIAARRVTIRIPIAPGHGSPDGNARSRLAAATALMRGLVDGERMNISATG